MIVDAVAGLGLPAGGGGVINAQDANLGLAETLDKGKFRMNQHAPTAIGIGGGLEPFGIDDQTVLVVLGGFATMGVYWWINKNVLTDNRFYDPADIKKKKDKPKLPLKESFAYLMKSKYLLALALLVIGYGVCIQLVEVTWKNQVKLQYPTGTEYLGFMGMFSQITSILTLFMMLFVGGNVIRKFGWKAGALFTPIVILFTGVAFFAFVIFRGQLGGFIAMMGTTPLMLAVIFGTAQNIMSKSSKYSLFDPTKEMAYIPLDQESKVKGKAVIDVVGARFGKAGGAMINQGLIVATGSIALIAPYVAGIMLLVLGVWIAAARSLGKQFTSLSTQREEEAKAAAAAAAAAAEAAPAAETEKSPQPTT